MKKEVAEKLLKDKGVIYIPYYKKVWYSITKFERYPEMAAEGVERAFLYLLLLIVIYSLIMSICVTSKLGDFIKETANYFEQNISIVNYEDGKIQIELSNSEKKLITDEGILIVDTDEIGDEQIKEYKSIIPASKIGIIWLKDHVVFMVNGQEESYFYKNILDEFNIDKFNKSDIINLLNNQINNPKVYIAYFLTIEAVLFFNYFIAVLIDILILSLFGVLTGWIARIKIRYRAIFNMSIYAITLSIILQFIYRVINLFFGFEIKYFDLMYTAIAYICLAAAIFMIKSDVVKQQIELIKIRENQKEEVEKKQEEEKEQKEEEESDEKDKEKSDKKEKKLKNKDKGIENEQGSNA